MGIPDLTTLSPEQLQVAIPAIATFILSGPDAYADGVDEITEWEIKDGVLTGVFVGRHPAGDRKFAFEINGNTGEYSFTPISGVEGLEFEKTNPVPGTISGQEAVDTYFDILALEEDDDVVYQKMMEFRESLPDDLRKVIDLGLFSTAPTEQKEAEQ